MQIHNGLSLRTNQMCCLVTRQLIYNPVMQVFFLVGTWIDSGISLRMNNPNLNPNPPLTLAFSL